MHAQWSSRPALTKSASISHGITRSINDVNPRPHVPTLPCHLSIDRFHSISKEMLDSLPMSWYHILLLHFMKAFIGLSQDLSPPGQVGFYFFSLLS